MPKEAREIHDKKARQGAQFHLSCQYCYAKKVGCSHTKIPRATHPERPTLRGSCGSCTLKNIDCKPRNRKLPDLEKNHKTAIAHLEYLYNLCKNAGLQDDRNTLRTLPAFIAEAKVKLAERTRARVEQQEAEDGTLADCVEATSQMSQDNGLVVDLDLPEASRAASGSRSGMNATTASAPYDAFYPFAGNADGPPPYPSLHNDAENAQRKDTNQIPHSARVTLPPTTLGGHVEPSFIPSDIVPAGDMCGPSTSTPPILVDNASTVNGGESASLSSVPWPGANSFFMGISRSTPPATHPEAYMADIINVFPEQGEFTPTNEDWSYF